MPNQNQPVFPNHRRQAPSPYWHYRNYRVLVPCPRTYFEVDDIRPGEDKLSEYTIEIFKSTDELTKVTIPKELNRKILQYLPGRDLLRFSMVSTKAFLDVEFSHALMYDAIHERINDLVKVLNKQRNQNKHKFRVGNCVQICKEESGYVVQITPKMVFYVMETDIFKKEPPPIHKIGNDNGVRPMHPYYVAVPVEVVKNGAPGRV